MSVAGSGAAAAAALAGLATLPLLLLALCTVGGCGAPTFAPPPPAAGCTVIESTKMLHHSSNLGLEFPQQQRRVPLCPRFPVSAHPPNKISTRNQTCKPRLARVALLLHFLPSKNSSCVAIAMPLCWPEQTTPMRKKKKKKKMANKKRRGGGEGTCVCKRTLRSRMVC